MKEQEKVEQSLLMMSVMSLEHEDSRVVCENFHLLREQKSCHAWNKIKIECFD